MREILFRGKRKDNDEWVYGFPLIDTADCSVKAQGKCVCPHDGSDAEMFYWEDNFHEYNSEEVMVETIGEYTGLTDKNGVKIFEGDIVKNKYDNLFIVKYGAYFPEQYVNYLCFMYGHEIFGLYLKGDDGIDYVMPESPNIEVVGNIFDNPELIENKRATS